MLLKSRKTSSPCYCLSRVTAAFSTACRWMTRRRSCHANFKQLWSKRWSRGMTSSTRTLTASQTKVNNKWLSVSSVTGQMFSLLAGAAACAARRARTACLWNSLGNDVVASADSRHELMLLLGVIVCIWSWVLVKCSYLFNVQSFGGNSLRKICWILEWQGPIWSSGQDSWFSPRWPGFNSRCGN